MSLGKVMLLHLPGFKLGGAKLKTVKSRIVFHFLNGCVLGLGAWLQIASAKAEEVALVPCAESGIHIDALKAGPKDRQVFRDGGVIVYAYNKWEPAAAGQGIAIVAKRPRFFAEGIVVNDCFAADGFAEVYLEKLKATYDPKLGQTFEIPVTRANGNFDPRIKGSTPVLSKTLKITNVAQGQNELDRGYALKASL